tara:strand:- start:9738 stop:14255 length:4518 start_codon:yes stop_codon:yes gene_type:complete
MSNNKMSDSSKIIGIQFSILSPEEIRKGSVAQITSRDTYINNKPVIGGLFDPRMGVLEPGLICPTDGLDYMKTPGYFGHIELARPVFYIQYLTTIMKIIRCVCFKCSKLLISKEAHKHCLTMTAEKRWNYVFQLASKVKRCGEECEDGCGCKQPDKVKKEGLATIIAEWSNMENTESEDSDKLTMKMIPEITLKIFKRISDDDVNFMGFSPIWSRPDWMICQVLAVPPPAVRPSVKHDAQQRSEDDISHIIVNIIKSNNTLQEKIQANANANIIDDWTTVLQYYIATMIDNKIPGVASVAQRSGRALKSIKERLNGKTGRVRGNLMGKRVDFSARSVITPDPNLSIAQLGVPMKIAMNLTKPCVVNKMNRQFLLRLVKNGPDVHPGAKILERKNGENISLRYVDRASITLEDGDTVHRHVMDNDAVLFNRQPTLHRMSMMCHMAKIMKEGNTFRMNVGDTKPYNADFDGDEMNLHMPQDEESEVELRNIAAVPYQMISPANNQSIVGVFQDSLLGAYRFTRPGIVFSPRDAMNLLMRFKNVNVKNLGSKEIKNFDILSQILPPLSLKYKTKLYKEEEDIKTSNNVLEIVKGVVKRGQIEKSVLGATTRGMIHRICNDFGNMASKDFIDDLQNIVTEYMKTSSYSVGISDLISDSETNTKIITAITEKKKDVKSLIDQTHLGIFENNTGKTNVEEFETQVNNILNKAQDEAGKIGRNSLDKTNRFVMMVNAGSKGSTLNIAQMISCLGQQNVDGKRIPYGYENRTLPHFSKFDDSPNARGFVESSFISGLRPEELFFHAMGGRVGLIDTAVKTSQTGYIQRRLIKGLEDLCVKYDMTVRNNMNKVIQFSYGDDGVDTVKVENQNIPITRMTVDEIYAHYHMPSDDLKDAVYTTSYTKYALRRIAKQKAELNDKCKFYIEYMIDARNKMIKNIFKYQDNTKVHIPVSFQHIINNIRNQMNITHMSMVDITPNEIFQLIEKTISKLEMFHYSKPTELFKVVYYFYLSPKELVMKHRFNKKAILMLLSTIEYSYKRALVSPGEMVGMIAAQSIGEPTTQMTLNTFHFAGVASKSNVTRGVPRIEEILSLSENPKNPSLTIYLKSEDEIERTTAQKVMNRLEHVKMRDITKTVTICFDPDDGNTLLEQDIDLMSQYNQFKSVMDECMTDEPQKDADSSENSKWVIRFEFQRDEMLDRNITMDDVHYALVNTCKEELSCIYTDYNSDKLIFRIRIKNISRSKKKGTGMTYLDQSDEIYMLKNFQEHLLNNIVLRGIKKIDKVILRKIPENVVFEEGNYVKRESWVLDTVGTNLMDIMALDYIDKYRTVSNDIVEIYKVLGIEAARQAIYDELADVIEFDGTYINYHHLSMLCDRMTATLKMVSIFRHGINNDHIGPIAKASFEETPEMFMRAAKHADLDIMRGVSANVMCGQEGHFGTNSFNVVLSMRMMQNLKAYDYEPEKTEQYIDDMFGNIEDSDDPCSKSNIIIKNNVGAINDKDTGAVEDDYDPGF